MEMRAWTTVERACGQMVKHRRTFKPRRTALHRAAERLDSRRAIGSILGAIALVDCTQSVLHAATQTSTWVGATSTNWSTASNWAPSNTDPNNGNAGISDFDVVINPPGSGDVAPILDVNATIDLLSVTTNATMTVGPSESLNVGGPTLTNNGTIFIDNPSVNAATMNITSSCTLTGSGNVMLEDWSPNASLTASAGAVLTNGETIHGVGEIDATLVNNGTVNADYSGQALFLQNGNVTNNNLLESTGSASTLVINGISVTQGSGGQISAAGGTVIIEPNSTVSNGSVSSTAASNIQAFGGTFNSVTISTGTNLIVEPGTTMTLLGSSITNNGTIQVDTNTSNAVLDIGSTMTISGSGSIVLDDYSPLAKLIGSTGVTLTTGASQNITGNGEVDVALVNNGTVNVTASGHFITLQTSNMSNNNLMEATAASSTLNVNGITITQASNASISAAGGDVILEGGATISNGTVKAQTGNNVQVTGATLNNVTIAAGTSLIVEAADTLNLAGSSITNNGTITVDPFSSNADLNIANSLTLTGTGTVTLNDYNPNARITAAAGATLTNDVNHTINGVGEIDAPLVNNGVVNATFAGHSILLQTSNMTNNNVMEATASGSSLILSGITVTQASGASISGAGGNILLQGGATIAGGTVTCLAANQVIATSGTLSNVTIASGTSVIVDPADTLNLAGSSITNNGTITVDQFSSNADLNIANSLTLTGTGTVALDDYSPNARITAAAGATLTNDVHQTINGIGEIDAPVVNNGTIQATVSGHDIYINHALTGSGTIAAAAGATLVLSPNIGGSSQGALSLSSTGKLDITNNHLIINYGAGPDPIVSITAWIKSGYAGGSWTGAGIVSTSAQTPTNGLVYGVGYADGKDGKVAGLSSGQIEVKYTLLGDANLDGLVNAADFTILAANFNQPVTGWDQGDFNYDGLVNAADFTDLAANFNQSASGAAVSPGDVAALDAFAVANGLPSPTFASVPEPAFLGFSIFTGTSLFARRRRRYSSGWPPSD